MTTIDRTRHLLWRLFAAEVAAGNLTMNADPGLERRLAQALADAGLLAPDPVAPTENGIIPGYKQWKPLPSSHDVIWTSPRGNIMAQNIEPGDMTPEEVAELLWLPEPHLSSSECDAQARDLAQALAYATPPLLMPDLPVSDDSGDWNIPGPGDLTVHNGRTPGPEVVLEDMGAESYDIFVMQPDEARHVALALLAAANYAEGNA